MQEELFYIQSLSVNVNSRLILQHLDLKVIRGESIAIVGNNGCGKTTLLKVMCGLVNPSQGILRIAGMSFANSTQALQLKRLIGYAADTPPLYHNDTVRSYLRFIAELKQIAKHQLTARVNLSLEVLDLTQVSNAPIYTLSKGTQQRVNLAQAILSNPEILVLDEPTTGLDPEHCQSFAQYLIQLQAQNITLIIASHEYTTIVPICDYMLKITNGTVQKIMLPLANKTIRELNDQIYSAT